MTRRIFYSSFNFHFPKEMKSIAIFLSFSVFFIFIFILNPTRIQFFFFFSICKICFDVQQFVILMSKEASSMTLAGSLMSFYYLLIYHNIQFIKSRTKDLKQMCHNIYDVPSLSHCALVLCLMHKKIFFQFHRNLIIFILLNYDPDDRNETIFNVLGIREAELLRFF